MTGPQAERVKKKICEIFQSFGLKITVKTNLQIMDFLDVTFNLKMKSIVLLENQTMTHYTPMLSQIIEEKKHQRNS